MANGIIVTEQWQTGNPALSIREPQIVEVTDLDIDNSMRNLLKKRSHIWKENRLSSVL